MPFIFFVLDKTVSEVQIQRLVMSYPTENRKLTFAYPSPTKSTTTESSSEAPTTVSLEWDSFMIKKSIAMVGTVQTACFTCEFDKPLYSYANYDPALFQMPFEYSCVPRHHVTKYISTLLTQLKCGPRAVTDFVTLYAPEITVGRHAMECCHVCFLEEPLGQVVMSDGSSDLHVFRYHFMFVRCTCGTSPGGGSPGEIPPFPPKLQSLVDALSLAQLPSCYAVELSGHVYH
eukprot:PhF_6_TR41694/c0_g1_i2/m.63245